MVGSTLIEHVADARVITSARVDGRALNEQVEYRLRDDDDYDYRAELRLVEELAALDAVVRRVEEDIIAQEGVQVHARVTEAIARKNELRATLNDMWEVKPEPLPSLLPSDSVVE
jgi:hypothetical protein